MIFSSIFTEEDSQKSVYEGTTKELVENLFHGQSAAVIAYGQTGMSKEKT